MGKPHLQFHQSKRFVSVSVEFIENGTLFKLRYSCNGCEMDRRFTTEIVTRDHAWLMTDTFGITPKFSWLRLRFRGGAEMIMCPYMLPYQYGNSHYIETLRRGSRHCIPCMSKVTINYSAPILSFVNNKISPWYKLKWMIERRVLNRSGELGIPICMFHQSPTLTSVAPFTNMV